MPTRMILVNTFSGGRTRLAEQMNGNLVINDSGDPDRQRLLNIVEEMAIASGVLAGSAVVLNKDEVVKRIGNPTEPHVDHARQLIKDLSQNLKRAAHSTCGAQALIYCLVLDKKQDELEKQLQYLDLAPGGDVSAEVLKLADEVGRLPNKYRLVLIGLALPTLRQLTNNQYRSFAETLRGLAASDGKADLFEWLLRKIVFNHLGRVFHAKKRLRKKEVSLGRTKEACTIPLSLFAVSLKQEGKSQSWIISVLSDMCIALKDPELAEFIYSQYISCNDDVRKYWLRGNSNFYLSRGFREDMNSSDPVSTLLLNFFHKKQETEKCYLKLCSYIYHQGTYTLQAGTEYISCFFTVYRC